MVSESGRGENSPLRERGFTLVEMIVTIGIIIMAAGFLVPSLATMFANRKLENAGTLISTVMNEARNSAVTKKQVHTVVFLRDGLRLYREAKGADPGEFLGIIKPYDPDNSGTLKYHLHFAELPFDQIPADLHSRRAESDSSNFEIGAADVVIRFMPDGTIDFGDRIDVPSFKFNESPPLLADIEIVRMGDEKQRGYIDIRPTGRTVFKLDKVMEGEN